MREQSITPAEALWAYTQAGAILSGDQANCGSITPGKWADLVVLSGDPLDTPTSSCLIYWSTKPTWAAARLSALKG